MNPNQPTNTPEEDPGRRHPVLLFDGECGFCSRWVQFVLRRDRSKRLRCASLQGPTGQALLRDHRQEEAGLGSVVLVVDGRVTRKSTAVLDVMAQLSAPWRALSAVGRLVPLAARDWAYDLVARHRYRFMGGRDRCPPIPSEDRARFLD